MYTTHRQKKIASALHSDSTGDGLAGDKNSRLLALAEEGFEVFITTDKNLRYQQNPAARKLAVTVLPTNFPLSPL